MVNTGTYDRYKTQTLQNSKSKTDSSVLHCIQTVSELFDKAAQDLFKKLQSSDHCLNSILPEEKSLGPSV